MSANSSRPSTPSNALRPSIDPNTSHPAHKLLAQAHPNDPETTSRIFTEKILHKPLLLSTSTEKDDKRTIRRHIRLRKKFYALKHARPKPLSAKEKRELHLYELRPDECRYEIYKGLNRLWRRYILEVLGYVDREGRVVKGKIGSATTASSGANLIASADFHGMEVEIVRSADVGRVGLKGIVVRETRSTITLVCDEKEDMRNLRRKAKRKSEDQVTSSVGSKVEQDKVRMVLKKGSVFRVRIELPTSEENFADATGNEGQIMEEEKSKLSKTNAADERSKRALVFELHGDQLEIRPIERAVKKFKWRPMDYL